jgi:kynurenine formamidase
MEYIDLSQQINDQTTSHPYDNQPRIFQDKYLLKDKFNNYRIDIGTHVGTHIDSPMHLTNSKKFICDYSLDRFVGFAEVIDACGLDLITSENLNTLHKKEIDFVLVYTGFSDKYGTNSYYGNHPIISPDFAETLIQRKIKVLGIDMPSPDVFPFEVHKKLFDFDIMIIENLFGLDRILNRKVKIYAFPLNIRADSSPVRVVAEIAD